MDRLEGIVMKSLAKLITVLLLISSSFVLSGCGNTNGVPDGSTIKVGPDFTQTGVFFSEVPVVFTIVVRFGDGSPIPHAKVNVSGHYATTSVTFGLYQFYLHADPTAPGNVPVNSPFDVVTDDNGTYSFSVLVSSISGTFKDTIAARSGTAFGSAVLQFN
jgi:hypothetical protein